MRFDINTATLLLAISVFTLAAPTEEDEPDRLPWSERAGSRHLNFQDSQGRRMSMSNIPPGGLGELWRLSRAGADNHGGIRHSMANQLRGGTPSPPDLHLTDSRSSGNTLPAEFPAHRLASSGSSSGSRGHTSDGAPRLRSASGVNRPELRHSRGSISRQPDDDFGRPRRSQTERLPPPDQPRPPVSQRQRPQSGMFDEPRPETRRRQRRPSSGSFDTPRPPSSRPPTGSLSGSFDSPGQERRRRPRRASIGSFDDPLLGPPTRAQTLPIHGGPPQPVSRGSYMGGGPLEMTRGYARGPGGTIQGQPPPVFDDRDRYDPVTGNRHSPYSSGNQAVYGGSSSDSPSPPRGPRNRESRHSYDDEY